MENTGFVQFDIYNNLLHHYPKYADFEVVDKNLLTTDAKKKETFIKDITYDKYVKFEVIDKRNDKKLLIVLLNKDEFDRNEIATTTEKFKSFISGLKTNYHEIIIVSPCDFESHVKNYYNATEGLSDRVKIYNYNVFKIVLPLAANCSEHIIADEKERTVFNENFDIVGTKDEKTKKQIKINDPQVIWLHAKPGDLIRIKRVCAQQSGVSVDYRYVY